MLLNALQLFGAHLSPPNVPFSVRVVRADYENINIFDGVEPSLSSRVRRASGTLAISRVGIAVLAASITEEEHRCL